MSNTFTKTIDKIDKMEKEIGKDIADALEELSKTIDAFEKNFLNALNGALKSIELEICGKLATYTEKYVTATFLTKWYWKRKMDKTSETLRAIMQFEMDFFGSDENKQSDGK